jgi:hypothetical protein
MILLSNLTVYRYIIESLGCISKRLQWLPDGLSDIEKEARVEKSEELSQLLPPMKRQSWKYIVTLDEVRLDLCTDSETIWLATAEPRLDRERKIVSSPTLMLTIMWNFMWLIVSPKGRNLTWVISYLTDSWRSGEKSLQQKTQLAFSHFCLFGDVKRQLTGQSFETREEF